jgi:hypothetical protein
MSICLFDLFVIKELWFESYEGQEMFIFPKRSKPDMHPTWLPIQSVPGVILPGVERSERGAVQSFPSSSYVKNRWTYTFIPS